MEFKKTLEKIKSFIEEKSWLELRAYVIDFRVPEIADILLELDEKNRMLLFRLLPKNISADVFSYLNWEYQHSLLKDLTPEETKYILNNLEPDDRTDFLEELPGKVSQRLLNMLSKEELDEAKKLLGYPEESAGRLMTPDYVAARPEWTISQLIKHIREKASRSETINMIYVTDENWKLLDSLKLRQVIMAAEEEKVRDIMDYSFVCLSAYDDREEAVRKMKKYDLYALPVLDSEGILVGIVTYDDVLDIAEEETTEDFHKTGGISPLKTSYKEAAISELFKKRIVWLVMLVAVNLAASIVMALYGNVIEFSIALVFFIPLLIASGGNTGAQSSTLVIRSIATGEIKLKEWKSIIIKEIKVGILLSLSLAALSLGMGFHRADAQIGMVLALSMFIIIICSNLIGVMLPFIFIKFNRDSAVASAPIITSFVDAFGLVIYFTIAVRILM